MFKVKAVESKLEQERICRLCNTDYIPNDFAYAAIELSSADDKDGDVIGICQFSFTGGCIVHSLVPAAGRESDEAMLILGFTVLEFLRRCGFSSVTADIPNNYAAALGFIRNGGTFTLDLTAPHGCGENKIEI